MYSDFQQMPPRRSHHRAVAGFVLCSLLVAFVLYGDSLAILSEFPVLSANSSLKFSEKNGCCSVAIGPLSFSLPTLVFVFFNGGGVFNRIALTNIDYAIYGRHVGADPKEPWQDLNFIKDCFPYDCRGEIYSRMEFTWHKLLGDASYKHALKALTSKIKTKYNREHPHNQIDKVAIYMVWWPRSEDGFYKLQKPGNTTWQLLAEE